MDVRIIESHVTAKDLQLRLEVFEREYGYPSSEFAEAFRNGQLDESPTFFKWARTYAAWKSAVGLPE